MNYRSSFSHNFFTLSTLFIVLNRYCIFFVINCSDLLFISEWRLIDIDFYALLIIIVQGGSGSEGGYLE